MKSLPAVVVLYLTFSVAYRKLFLIKNRNFHSALENKTTKLKTNKTKTKQKHSDYYYLSSREMINILSSKLAKVSKRTSLFSRMRLQYGSLTEEKDKAGSTKVINLGI